jgi:hypothetical protein
MTLIEHALFFHIGLFFMFLCLYIVLNWSVIIIKNLKNGQKISDTGLNIMTIQNTWNNLHTQNWKNMLFTIMKDYWILTF